MDWLKAELSKAYEIQTQKLGGSKGQKAEGKVLNMISGHTADGWEIKADPRHAELVIEQLGLEGDSSVATSGVSGADEEEMTMCHWLARTSLDTGESSQDAITSELTGQTPSLPSRKGVEKWANPQRAH